jgi:hypothetical protein
MAILAVQRPLITGTVISMAAAGAGGDSFQNDGSTWLRVTNGAGSPINVTFDSPNTCDFGLGAAAAHDSVVAVANGTTVEIGPFRKNRFNDANERVQVTYSSVTTITVAAITR